MRRKIYDKLLEWKKLSCGESAVIINGARRVGKSYVAKDFLVTKSRITTRHNISPIEVKSTQRYTLTSMKKCLTKYGSYIATPYVVHTADLKKEDGIIYLPLYMTPLL